MEGILFLPLHLIVPLLNEWSYFLPLPVLPPCKFWKRQILFPLSWDSLPQMAQLCLGMPSSWPVGRHSRGFEGHLVYTLPFFPLPIQRLAEPAGWASPSAFSLVPLIFLFTILLLILEFTFLSKPFIGLLKLLAFLWQEIWASQR